MYIRISTSKLYVFLTRVILQHGELDKECYKGYADRSKGYDYSLLVGLKDKAALERYATDVYHTMFVKTILSPILNSTEKDPVLAVDWEGNVSPATIL